MNTLLYFVRHPDGGTSYWKIEPFGKSSFVMVQFLSASGTIRQVFPMLKTKTQPMIEKARASGLSVTLVTEIAQ